MNKSTHTTAVYWLTAAFVAGFLTVGYSYWQIPYAKISLPDTLYGPGLLGVGVLAFAARAIGKARILTVILVVDAAVPAAVLSRVAVDTANDSTSHNLWPLELIIAAAVGMAVSFAGALLGSLPSCFSKH